MSRRTVACRRRFAIVTAVLATSFLPGAERPNIVCIVADSLGWRDLPCYGHTFHETVAIDRLAREGVRFTKAYTAAPEGAPAFCGLLTGRHPARFARSGAAQTTGPISAVGRGGAAPIVLPPEVPTVARSLRAAGYSTAFLGRWHFAFSETDPKQLGFDTSIVTRGGHFAPRFDVHPFESIPDGRSVTTYLTGHAEEFIRAAGDAPFFLLLSHHLVDLPIEAEQELVGKYVEKGGAADGINHPVYAAMIEALDRSVGRVLAALEASGALDKTIVILTSTNGALERQGAEGPLVTKNSPLRGQKGTLYEGGLRVPFIVRWPRTQEIRSQETRVEQPGTQRSSTAPVVNDSVVSVLDVFPTVLAAAGETVTGVDGMDLSRVLRAESIASRTLFWHAPSHGRSGGIGAVRSGQYKLIEFQNDDRLELYDIDGDFGERLNLGSRMERRVQSMRVRLHEWRKAVGVGPSTNVVSPSQSGSPPAEEASPPARGAVDRNRLRELARDYARDDLPPLLEFLDGTPVRTAEDWRRRREEIRILFEEYFVGTFPRTVPRVRGGDVLQERRGESGDVRREILLEVETRNRVRFRVWVWIPPGDGPFPLLLTQPRDYQIPWAERALERGYMVCLYPGVDSHHREPDYPGYESVWKLVRVEYPEATWTEISTKAWIASRVLDFLLAAENEFPVQRNQVGIIGFSRYGKQAMVAAAFDERIKSVVARSPGSPASSPYRFTSRDTHAEAPADFPGLWFLPSLRGYTGRENRLPIDAHGWYALIAPRHCLIHTAYNDGSEPTFAVERAFLAGRKVYERFGVGERLRLHYRPGQHGPITPEQRQQNLDWLDLSFGRGEATLDDFPEKFLHRFDWQAWKQRDEAGLQETRFSGIAVDDVDRRRRLVWLLGSDDSIWKAPEAYTFLTDAESAMMTHDRWAVPDSRRVPVSFGPNVRGNVYYSRRATAPLPVVIWLHPYSYHSGYNEGYGVEGTTVYHRLAREGFLVLAYDQCGFGLRLLEGPEFYTRHPTWSRLGRMVHDVRAAVDFLRGGAGRAKEPLPEVREDQIFVLGSAVGGMVGLYAAALDERIAGVASFSGFTPTRSGGLRKFWEWHALAPRLGYYEGKEASVPFDYDDVLKLIAPRPVLIVSPLKDRTADAVAVRQLVERARKMIRASGLEERVSLSQPDDYQRFQKAQQDAFVQWAREVLKTSD